MLSELVNNREMDSRRRMDEWSGGQMDMWVSEWMDGQIVVHKPHQQVSGLHPQMPDFLFHCLH